MINRKYFIIGVMSVGITLTSFGQKCVKFVDYQNKTVNTKGLNLQVFGQPVGVGATEVSSIQRAASDKMQQLDLLQFNICEQMKNIKTDFMREKLQAQYTNLLMQMMNLQNADGNNEVADFAKQVTDNQGNKEQTSKKEKKEKDVTPEPKPVQNDEQVIPPTPKPSSDDSVLDVDVDFPCFGDKFLSSQGFIRASGMETSMDANIAKRAARTVALEELASKIEITVKSVTEDYFLRTQKGMNEEIEKRIEGKTQTSVNQTLKGYKTVCEKMTQNKQTQKYSCYIALEMSEESVLKPVFNELQQDDKIKNALPNYEKFKETFDQVMNTYEESF